ncbi:MAG: (d)CMP kinase [Bacillales bacterium]|jgi:cytidylate kinase|nr:(d)CMP kinase [Bacillales bacterium]
MEKIIIAIDGPAGAGKSTIAKKLASLIDYIYIDTGAMYRAITYKALSNNIDIYNDVLMGQLTIESVIEFNSNKVLLDGEDVTRKIRGKRVNQNVSQVSALLSVRKELVHQQRKIGSEKGVVMDGRDIGTVVFPQAELKLFVTASVHERAQRRYEEKIKESATDITLQEIEEELIIRDEKDSSRAISPLKKANDAIILDTTNLTQEESVNIIYNYYLKLVQVKND